MPKRATFQTTAEILRSARERAKNNPGSSSTRTAALLTIEAIARDFANQYGRENPRFDRAKFAAACGFDTL